MIDAAIIERLKQAAGPGGFTEDQAEIAPHMREWRGKYRGMTPLMLKPATTAQVSAILRVAFDTGTPVVPQGGNTGLVGGQIPHHGEVLLSLARMNRIRAVDADGQSITAEAGAILKSLQVAADDAGMLFPLSLAAEGSCTIGGNLATNAGGVNVLRYGMTRELVLGVEVVLANGDVLDHLRTLRKDNTGYDLKQLFIGAEGTLGIITAAALKLFPKPRARATVFAALPSVEAAVALLSRMQAATGGLLNAFELIGRPVLEMVLAHIPDTRDPLTSPAPWYVLFEASGGEGFDLAGMTEAALARAMEDGVVLDAAIAASGAQAAQFWRLREEIPEAERKGGASIKHDISVPISAIPRFIDEATAAAGARIPGIRSVAFGHLGDGNLHFNFVMPEGGDAPAFLARWDEIQSLTHDIVGRYNGSVSAEHGIGIQKKEAMARQKGDVAMELMRTLKHALDPKNILNPGKIV